MKLTSDSVARELEIMDAWQTIFGSSSRVGLQVKIGAREFRVVHQGKVIHQGTTIADAVKAFNDADLNRK